MPCIAASKAIWAATSILGQERRCNVMPTMSGSPLTAEEPIENDLRATSGLP
jgi:hypothetical protein